MFRCGDDNNNNNANRNWQSTTQGVSLTAHGAATADRFEDSLLLVEEENNTEADSGGWTERDSANVLLLRDTGIAYDEYLGLKFYHTDPLPLIEQQHAILLQAANSGSSSNHDSTGLRFVDWEFPTHRPIKIKHQQQPEADAAKKDTPTSSTIPNNKNKESTKCDTTPTTRVEPGIITSSNIRDFLQSGEAKRVQRIAHFVDCASREWHWVRASSFMTSGSGCSLFASSDANANSKNNNNNNNSDDEYKKSIHVRNIIQGRVGNCGFCSGLASLTALRPEAIRDAFGVHSERCLRSCGAVSIRMYLSDDNDEPRYLLLDDFVLCTREPRRTKNTRTGKTVSERQHYESPSIHATTQSFIMENMWPRLLEKAFVKVQGSYASLDGYYKYNSLYRHPGRALQLLTGSPVALELHFCGQNERGTNNTFSTVPSSDPNSTPTTIRMDEIYRVLASTQNDYARIAHCRHRQDGLQTNHGYSLLWVGKVSTVGSTTSSSAIGSSAKDRSQKNVALVCLRNPHGRGSYTGPHFGVRSTIWNTEMGQHVASQLLLLDCFCRGINSNHAVTWRYSGDLANIVANKDDRNNDDGIFFMTFDIFVQFFPVVTVVGPLSRLSKTMVASVTPTKMTFRTNKIFQMKENSLRKALEIFTAVATQSGCTTGRGSG